MSCKTAQTLPQGNRELVCSQRVRDSPQPGRVTDSLRAALALSKSAIAPNLTVALGYNSTKEKGGNS